MPTDRRRHETFGGLVPTDALARGGDTVVAALALEHHADGAALPLLVLSDAPGPLEWADDDLQAVDDAGGRYAVRALSVQSGLGALETTLWLEPAVPAGPRRLELTVSGLDRRAAARGGGAGALRPLVGGPWALAIDLVPGRTAVAPPPTPPDPPPPARSASIPARSASAFCGLVPVGQARVDEAGALCLLALERYAERSVLTLATLPAEGAAARAAGRLAVDAWDDRGARYAATPIHAVDAPGWSEASVELVPALSQGAAALGVRVGEARFGIALPPAPR